MFQESAKLAVSIAKVDAANKVFIKRNGHIAFGLKCT